MKLGRKSSGGRYKKPNQVKLYARKGKARVVNLGKNKAKLIKGRGSMRKMVCLSADKVNLIVNGRAKQAIIKNVLETPANRFLARQNILVKGAIIDTDTGKARITNRPSQEGMVQAKILVNK